MSNLWCWLYFCQGIHEMGTARMGRDPKPRIEWQYQVWVRKNVFVTERSLYDFCSSTASFFWLIWLWTARGSGICSRRIEEAKPLILKKTRLWLWKKMTRLENSVMVNDGERYDGSVRRLFDRLRPEHQSEGLNFSPEDIAFFWMN